MEKSLNELERFIEWVGDIVREFYYIHEHFRFEADRHIKDFEDAFARWHHDVFNKYEHIVVNMEWPETLNTLKQKLLLLTISFHGVSFFTLRYRVGDRLHKRFGKVIEKMHLSVKEMVSLCGGFIFYKGAKTEDFRQFFEGKKRKFLLQDPEIDMNIEWANAQPLIEDNTLFLISTFRDEYSLKQMFSNKLFGRTIVLEKVDLKNE